MLFEQLHFITSDRGQMVKGSKISLVTYETKSHFQLALISRKVKGS